MAKRFLFLGMLIIACILGYFTLGFWLETNPIAGIKSRLAAQAYYDNLAKGDFEQAFANVGYFEEASDLEPKIPYEEAKRIWVNRLTSLKAQGTYLKEVKNIDIYVDDGYPNGRAEVVVVQNGQTQTWVEQIHFGRLKGDWKVQAVWKAVGDQNEPLYNRARYGYIPHNFTSAEIREGIAKLNNRQSVNIGKYKLSFTSRDSQTIIVSVNSRQEENVINRQYIDLEFNEVKNDFAVLRLSYPVLDKYLNNMDIKLKLVLGNRILDYQQFVNTQIEKDPIKKYIEEGIASPTSPGAPFAAYEILGERGEELYLWAYYQKFSLKGDVLEMVGGGSLPVVLTRRGSQIVGHQVPGDGSYYYKDVKAMFPENLHNKILKYHSYGKIQIFDQQTEEAAKLWFGVK